MKVEKISLNLSGLLPGKKTGYAAFGRTVQTVRRKTISLPSERDDPKNQYVVSLEMPRRICGV